MLPARGAIHQRMAFPLYKGGAPRQYEGVERLETKMSGKIYVASYATQMYLEAEQDDPSIRSEDVTGFATPEFTAVGLDAFALVEKCKGWLQEELLDELEADQSAPKVTWNPLPWKASGPRRMLVVEAWFDGEHIASIVVFETEME